MSKLASATVHLYRHVLHATWRSLTKSWVSMVALILFALLFLGIARIAAPLGMAGGLLLGMVNALLVGATLRLIEQSLCAVQYTPNTIKLITKLKMLGKSSRKPCRSSVWESVSGTRSSSTSRVIIIAKVASVSASSLVLAAWDGVLFDSISNK